MRTGKESRGLPSPINLWETAKDKCPQNHDWPVCSPLKRIFSGCLSIDYRPEVNEAGGLPQLPSTSFYQAKCTVHIYIYIITMNNRAGATAGQCSVASYSFTKDKCIICIRLQNVSVLPGWFVFVISPGFRSPHVFSGPPKCTLCFKEHM